MIPKIVSCLSLALISLSTLSAQLPTTEISFCPAGLMPDGFVDWTKLPPAQMTGTVTSTIPVSGVSDLTATFQVSGSSYFPSRPMYAVRNSADLQVVLGVNPIVIFSRPIRGISVSFQSIGRFGHNFKMTAYSSTGLITSVTPPEAQVTTTEFDWPSSQVSASPLQIRSRTEDIVAVSFDFGSDPDETGGFDLINFRVESGSGSVPGNRIPASGLKEWLRADRTNVNYYGPNYAGIVTSWPDQSGNSADATPPTQQLAPSYILDGPNCTSVVTFAGSNQLDFNLPINGWTEMTVFLAGQSYADSAGWYDSQALIWNETQPWGTTFVTPSQTNAFFRFGTTQVDNQPVYSRRMNIGGDFSVTTAIHNSSTDSLYINGALVLRQQGKYPAIAGTLPQATIGAGLNNTHFTGNIGEILIYNRALGAGEREMVERYLMTKYGVH